MPRKTFNIGSSSFFKTKKRQIGYSEHGRKVLRETPGLLSAVNLISKANLSEYRDPSGKFVIISRSLNNLKDAKNINKAYVLDVGGQKYFIKEVNDSNPKEKFRFKDKYEDGRDGFSEHIGIEILKDRQKPVIPVHFSYTDPTSKRSFVVYEFTQLRTLHQLLQTNEIGELRARNVYLELRKIEKEINSILHQYNLPDYFKLSDLDIKNVFYRKKGEHYIFDPLLEKKINGGCKK